MTQAATEPAQALVGRDRELETLERMLAEAAAGEARFAQIVGEPGIGKTYLAAELGRRAASQGWVVLYGRSTELEREVPFGVLVNAFDAHLAALDTRTWDRVAPDELGELAAIFPSLRRLVVTPEFRGTPRDRYRAFRTFVELVEKLAAPKPLMVICDDLHWADDASSEHLSHLLRQPPEAAIMAVSIQRSGDAEAALAAALDEAVATGRVERIDLGPLAGAEAERLVRDLPDGAELSKLSGGNPYFLLELARSSAARRTALAGERPLPDAVGNAIAEEVGALSESGRDLAEAAAVLGDPFAADLAQDAAGLDPAAARSTLEDLAARGLMRPGARSATWEFRHPLVRTAIYDACPPGRKFAAHERAAALLAARGAPATERAHHVEHAARHGDPDALAVLREAGTTAAARAPAIAARWFETALRLLPPDAPRDDRLELRLALARSLVAIGQLEDAHTRLLEGLELAGADASLPRLRVVFACAGVEQVLGRHKQADERLRGLLQELPPEDADTAAEVMTELALSAFHRRDYGAMREWGSGALERARAGDDGALAAMTAAVAALAATCTGDLEQATRDRDEAIRLLDGLSDADLMRRPDGLRWLSTVDLFVDRFADGIKHAKHGLEVARAGDKGDVQPGFAQSLGNLLVATGCLEDARAYFDRAVEAVRLIESPPGLAWNLANRAHLATAEGDVDGALLYAEEATAIARDLEGTHVATRAAVVLGEAALEQGDGARAATLLTEGAGGEEMPLLPAARRPASLETLTRARIAAGDEEGAARAAAASAAAAAAYPAPLGTALAERAAAFLALDRGDVREAADRALSAGAVARGVGAPIEAAIAQSLAGTALARLGETDAALEQLEEAVDVLDGCGATRWRDRAERELGKLGRRAHLRTKPGAAGAGGVAALTGREYEIARLVAERRTNPEIAAELFLSVKAVETHLRNVFRKLDVSSRVEVERAVQASGSS